MATRGRKAIVIDVAEFQNQVTQLEMAQPDGKFPNRSALWSAFESTEWAKGGLLRPLTAQVAMIKAKEFNLNILTPVGQRGRVKGQGPVNVVRKPKKFPADALASLNSEVPDKYTKLVKRVCKGSLKAAIKLKCLECTNFQQKEVRLCTITGCPLWAFRSSKHPESLTEKGRQRISLGLLDAKENENEPDSVATVV